MMANNKKNIFIASVIILTYVGCLKNSKTNMLNGVNQKPSIVDNSIIKSEDEEKEYILNPKHNYNPDLKANQEKNKHIYSKDTFNHHIPHNHDISGYDEKTMELQHKATKIILKLLKSIKQNSKINILYNLKQLKEIKVDSIGDTFTLVDKLIEALNIKNNLETGLKLLITRQARNFVHGAFLYRYKQNPNSLDGVSFISSEIKQELISKIEVSLKLVSESQQVSGSLRFELQVLRAAIGAMPDEKNKNLKSLFKTSLKAMVPIISKSVIATGALIVGSYSTSIKYGSQALLDTFKSLYKHLKNHYRQKWYLSVLFLDALKEIKSIESLEAIQQLLSDNTWTDLSNLKTGDWQIFYAGLDALTSSVLNKNEEISKNSFLW